MTADETPRKLLFLSHVLPHPPDRGVAIRTHHLLRALSTEFHVTALCFYRWKGGRIHRDLQASVRALEKWAEVEVFPIPQEHSRTRLLWDHGRSVLTRRPYTHFLYDSQQYADALEHRLSDKQYDLVHADTLDLSYHFPALPDVPLIVGHHNLDSQLLRRRADYEANRLRGLYMRHQADLLEREIRRWCGRAALNLTVSDGDREAFQELVPGGRFVVVPNGVDVEAFQPGHLGSGEGLVFVGGTTWRPNEDALQFFCEKVLPLLRERGHDPPVRWVGRCDEAEKRRFAESFGVELTGYVEDVRPYVRNAACYVVPLRIGGGTRLKVVEAWALGSAMVSTSQGCEGLDARDGDNLLVRDDPEAFADGIVRILEDEELRRSLGRRGRRTAEEKYSWRTIGEELVERYRRLVGSADAGDDSPARELPTDQ